MSAPNSGRYANFVMTHVAAADCILCGAGASAPDEPGEIDALLAALEAHRCEWTADPGQRGKPATVETE